ncbi:MAG: hypothetical protein QOI88_1924 [Gammaproteobacteria bacterium]|nr:hypothetical protein [Gammaproteobacteria bacterium]
MYTTKCIHAAIAASCLLGTVQAAPPSASPYVTDPQSEYVQDTTADSISSLNMVLCIVGSMGAGSMVNAGPYIALVDMNKCDSKKASGAAAGATNYATAVLDVTRASNNDPMLGKVWLSMSEEGNAVDVFIHLSATESPSSTQPYGLFRLDYLGKKNGVVGFNGFVDSQASSISQYETGNNSNNTAMALSATSTTAGAGTITAAGSPTFDFAYDATHFRRSDGTNDQCFDRSKANAQVSVWQYGTYNALDGTRVDMAHPGFPIEASYAGVSYYGFANYWGINFQGLDLNTIPDAQPISGLTVTDQRPSNKTSYTLSKVGGKLTKWTQVATKLDSLNNIPITVSGDLTGLTDNSAVTGSQWQMQWSSTTHAFTVIGQQQCDSSGCRTTPLSPVANVTASSFNGRPISGWADSYGGNITIPSTGAPHVFSDPVYYYLQSTVIPGTAALSLYCLSQCPTAASLAAFKVGSPQGSPFGNGTDQQWFTAPAANTVSYSFDAGGLEDSSGGATPSLVLEQASQYPQGSMYAQNGINTGRLFDTPLLSTNCPMTTPGIVCEPASPSSYYTWATGPQQWQQSLWLSNGTAVVALDAPQNISYTVPNDPAVYGSYAGLPILLQFNGFGNLYGIPGSCVDPVNNDAVPCTANARYVPLFSIPDGATMTLPNPSTPLIVKALNAEIRLKNLGANAAACASMTLAGIAPPTGGTHDPSNSADSFYIGVKPTVTASPKVIDGDVQP